MNSYWQPSDPNQATVTGAVYDALAVSQAALGGVSTAAIWEAFDDGTFGVIDENYILHPAGYMLAKMRQSLPGQIVSSSFSPASTSLPLNALAFATKNASGACALMLINYDQAKELQVQVTLQGTTINGTIIRYELSAVHPNGNSTVVSKSALGNILVPANSVVILDDFVRRHLGMRSQLMQNQ
ncbi:MAG: hypothetical protein ACLQFI_17655 [Methylocella sp.]